jgi:DNA polymerase-3 subunit epsilon/CBS domain-containing protein
VRIVNGELAADAPFRHLVNPGIPIPAEAARVHGIVDSAVVDAPRFADVWPRFVEYLNDSVVVGHTISFDLSVLNQECQRIGARPYAAAALDVRLLAEVAEPGLAGYALEDLTTRLGIKISGRHSAVGDATAAAQIFCSLVPRLRQRGIRTLGEALRACQMLRDHPNATQHSALGGAQGTPGAREVPVATRIDTFPYRHRVTSVMTTPAQTISSTATIGNALEHVTREKISSLFVTAEPRSPVAAATSGIITERDMLRALNSHGAAALNQPVDRFASRPLSTVAADAFVYQAIARMNRLRVRHLGVVDDAGSLIGALSARDQLRLRNEGAAELGDEIDQAADARDLAQAWAKLPPAIASLLNEGSSARDAAAVISNEIGRLTKQAVMLAERFMQANGQGDPPARYAFLVLGSAGRHESLLAMDQDNALVFEGGAQTEVDRWFETLASHASDILDQVGVPYCRGGVMAKNPAWRGALSDWRIRIDNWVQRSSPQDLLSIDIFFDVRGVAGNIGLAKELRRLAYDAAKGRADFTKLLIDAGGEVPSARTWWGGFRTDEGRIDLKKAGLFRIVGGARALAICHGIDASSTPARLQKLKELKIGAESDLDNLLDAHSVFLDLILKQQLIDIQRGRPPDNTVDVGRVSRRERARLRTALKSVETLDVMVRDLLF